MPNMDAVNEGLKAKDGMVKKRSLAIGGSPWCPTLEATATGSRGNGERGRR